MSAPPALAEPRIATLRPPPGVLKPAELGRLTGVLAADEALWRPLVRHNPQQRWYTRLYGCADFEVWLIGWEVDQDTALHDHGGSSGAFTVCEGRLVEDHTSLHRAGSLRHALRAPGTPREFGPACVHDLVNRGPALATSIHAYSPPLTLMNFYEHAPGGRLRRVGSVPVSGPEPRAGERGQVVA